MLRAEIEKHPALRPDQVNLSALGSLMLRPVESWAQPAGRFLSEVAELTNKSLEQALDQADVCGPRPGSLLRKHMLQGIKTFIKGRISTQLHDAYGLAQRELTAIVILNEASFKKQCDKEEAYLTMMRSRERNRQIMSKFVLGSHEGDKVNQTCEHKPEDKQPKHTPDSEPDQPAIRMMATLRVYYFSAAQRFVENVVMLKEDFWRSLVKGDLKRHLTLYLDLAGPQKGK
jgi:hypothetical protein